MEIVGCITLIMVGVVLGLTGGGGSVLSVPILVYLFSMDVVLASAYSFFIVGTTSVVGAILKQKERLIDVETSLLFGFPSLLATFVTRIWVVPNIPEIILSTTSIQLAKREFFLVLISILMILSGVMVLTQFRMHQSKQIKNSVRYIIMTGLGVGFLSGLTGIGGGFLILPALLLLKNMSFKTATGTALVIVSVNSIFGFLGDAFNYSINWMFLFAVTGLAVGGIIIGTLSNKIIPASVLQKTFGWITLLAGCYIILGEIFVS